MIDILLKILSLFIIMVLSMTIHELGHVLECKLQSRYCHLTIGIGGQIYKNRILTIKLFPVVASVETNTGWLKNKFKFYIAGAKVQIIFAILLSIIGFATNTILFYKLSILFAIYSIPNLIPYFPINDAFCYLRHNDKFEKWYLGLSETIRGLWILIGSIISFIVFTILTWTILF